MSFEGICRECNCFMNVCVMKVDGHKYESVKDDGERMRVMQE